MIWNTENLNGYKPFTTFWQDFTIAEQIDKGVEDTFKRAFKEWKSDYKYITELALVLNHKCWQHYKNGNKRVSNLYSRLYDEVNDYAITTLKGNELTYYFNITD